MNKNSTLGKLAKLRLAQETASLLREMNRTPVGKPEVSVVATLERIEMFDLRSLTPSFGFGSREML